MYIKQLSVFLENKEGSMQEVAKVLNEEKVEIISFSLADTSEYGMLRMVVNEPEKGQKLLKENGFSAMLTDVIAVEMDEGFLNLSDLLILLSKADLNVEYMYTVTRVCENAALILKASDLSKAIEAIEKNKIKILKFEELIK